MTENEALNANEAIINIEIPENLPTGTYKVKAIGTVKDSAGNDMVWRAGRKYIYLITVQPDRFDVEVRTTEWDEVAGSVGDIVFQ